MMQEDIFGAPTTSPQGALDGINDFLGGFVNYETRAVNVIEAADTNPDSALAQILAGILWMFLERPEAVQSAEPYAAKARGVGQLNEREQGLLALLDSWIAREHSRILPLAEALIARHPEDLATVKLAQYHAFNLANRPMMVKCVEMASQANQHQAPWHSMRAFAYEEAGNKLDAERAAMRALELNADDPWAHHAMAHLLHGRGDIELGKRLLADVSSSWNGLNSFMYTHNWWHVALFELAVGKVDAALSIYDTNCWGVEPDYSQDQVGAVSLLARLEMAGKRVGHRWDVLRPYLETRADDVLQPFLSVQYLYGLTRSKSPAADALLQVIRAQESKALVPEDKPLWRSVGIPLAEGLYAHAQGEHEKAVRHLKPLQPHWHRMGGSHAQRDLFAQVYLDALVNSGRELEALDKVNKRLRMEPDNPKLVAWQLAFKNK